MSRSFLDRTTAALSLALLALGVLLMSAFFFSPLHHGRAVARHGRILPGLTLGLARPGFVVTSVQSRGDAAQQGIAVGDAVIAIDGKAFHSLDQAAAYLVGAPGDTIVLKLRHGAHLRSVSLDRSEE